MCLSFKKYFSIMLYVVERTSILKNISIEKKIVCFDTKNTSNY